MRREVGTPGCAQSGLTGHATLSDPHFAGQGVASLPCGLSSRGMEPSATPTERKANRS